MHAIGYFIQFTKHPSPFGIIFSQPILQFLQKLHFALHAQDPPDVVGL